MRRDETPVIRELPDDCLPPPDVIEAVLRGPAVGPDGRIAGGVYHGKTPPEVLAEREEYRRLCGE